MSHARFLAAALLAGVALAAVDTPPPFFLQDPADSLCLAGETFKRCSIDTLFYVVGTPGNYQIHKRSHDGVIDEQDDGLCIVKKNCKDVKTVESAKLAKCSHCGAKLWNILGEAETGYVLSYNDGETCLFREQVKVDGKMKSTDKALTAPCDSTDMTYVPLQLQFASPSDIKTMASPGARLVGAASDGDLQTLKDILSDSKSNIDVNARDWDELTALIPAASGGHEEICRFLIEKGIDIDAKDKDGITALMEASIMGHVNIVKLLLEKGARVDDIANSEVTAMWLAASEGQTECMHVLLDNGADPTNTRIDGLTALMTASAGGHVQAVKLLLEKDVDPTAVDKENLTPLMTAAESGNVELLEILTNDHDDAEYLNTVSNSGFTALIIAAANGKTDAVNFLLEKGASTEVSGESKVTALMYAAASDYLEVVQALVEKGNADIHAVHNNGGTALVEASTGGSEKVMRYLIEKGAQYDFKDGDGVTPLMAVASNGNLNGLNLVVDSLKKDMSDSELTDHINMLSLSGGSAVMFSASGGHTNCTRRLIDLGADINAVARATPEYLSKMEKDIAEGRYPNDDTHVDGVTALHVAAQGGHLESAKLLVDSGAKVEVKDDEGRTPLMLAIKGNYGQVASMLVEAGADPNSEYTDESGEKHNLLFDSLLVENDDFAKLLVEKGADLYFKDDKQVTTLLQASHRGLNDVVKAILDAHNAKSGSASFIDDASDEGITPLIAAASEGHIDVVKTLISAKVNINAKDQDGTTALMAASARGHAGIVKELLAAGAQVNEQNSDGHSALMFAYNGMNQVKTLWERYNQYMKESAGGEKVDDGGTGPIIREALDNHTALVDLLLSNGADESLKDKEGHTAKDFDFHPDADSEVINKAAKAEKIRDSSKNEL